MPKARVVHYLKDDSSIACNRHQDRAGGWSYATEALRVNCKSCRRVISSGSVQLALNFRVEKKAPPVKTSIKPNVLRRIARKLGLPYADYQ